MNNQSGLLSKLGAWLKRPYSDDMSAGGWFAFFGLVIVLSFLWSRVLKVMAAGVDEL